jgi:ribosomal protein S18 acetylase RimI-like enzyme
MTLRAALLRRTFTLKSGRALLVRPARESDAPALVALRDSVAAEGEFILATPGDRSVLEEELSLAAVLSEGSLSIVGEVDGELAGHLLVQRRSEAHVSHIGDLAIIVENKHRDLGLGRSLLTVAIEWARAVGLVKLSLGVLTTNERAIALYHSIGFVDEGVRRAHIRMDEGARDLLLMGLRL